MKVNSKIKIPLPAADATHLTTDQLAVRLHRDKFSLANWRQEGKGPRFIPGRPVLYPISEVIKWENEQLRSSTAESC